MHFRTHIHGSSRGGWHGLTDPGPGQKLQAQVHIALMTLKGPPMGFTESIRVCFSKFFTFSGRAARPEFWWFVLFAFVTNIILTLLDEQFFGLPGQNFVTGSPLSGIFGLVVFFPLLAAAWRRLHDTGRPGWWALMPIALNILGMVGLFSGILAFATLENRGADQDTLLSLATILGVNGILLVLAAQFVMTVLLIWWCSRPGDPGVNAWGAPPLR